MKNRICRVLSMGLALASLLPCIACTKEPEANITQTTVQTQDLIVEKPPVVYSEEQINQTVSRATALSARIIRLMGGPVLEETQKQKLNSELREQMIPLFKAQSVYPSEADQLLTTAESVCDSAESGETEMRLLLLQLYQKGISVLGSDRIGRIAYAVSLIKLRLDIETAERRFEENPKYTWYQENAERYTALKEQLETIVGEQSFTEMVEILVFCLSTALDSAGKSNGKFDMTEEELLTVLRLQANRFATVTVTAEQWQCVTAVLSEWAPESDGSLLEEELRVLNDADYGQKLALLMPNLLKLYRAAVIRLGVEDLRVLKKGSKTDWINVIAKVLAGCEAELTVVANGLESTCATATDKEKKILEYAKLLESYNAFAAEQTETGFSQMMDRMRACAATPDEANAKAFSKSLTAYFHGIAPYLTFVLTETAKGDAVC